MAIYIIYRAHLKTQAAAVSVHPQHFTVVFFNETGTPLVCSIRVRVSCHPGEIFTRCFVQSFFDLGWDLFLRFLLFLTNLHHITSKCSQGSQKWQSPVLFSLLCNHNFGHWPTGNENSQHVTCKRFNLKSLEVALTAISKA